MADREARKPDSVFVQQGFTPTIEACKSEIQELYLGDRIPWVIGYSGGKDSTAILQLIWLAISELSEEQRNKTVHVISTDTLVENPVVAAWVSRSLEAMRQAAERSKMPILPHRLTPEISDTFWVNLIGRGYPAPRLKFRWCTHRLKIKPSNQFIRDVVQQNGEAILVLGTRKSESMARGRSMAKHEKKAVGKRLTPNASLHNSLVYTPIEDWSNDDVWAFLMRVQNFWGHSNKDLLGMYSGASEDGECPLVVDLNTPSCGNSRFGCWVCTLVDQDKSMGAMIQNDDEKEWMLPLLKLRGEFDFRGEEARERDRQRRDYRRITGKLTSYTDVAGETRLVHGPYKQDTRAYWLRRVLETQKWIRDNGPDYVRGIDLITEGELQEIRRLWVVEKHEIEDLLPQIYQETMGEDLSEQKFDDNRVFGPAALELLREQCGSDELHFELVRNLLDIEWRYRMMTSRRGLYGAIESAIERCFYTDEEDALKWAEQQSEYKRQGSDLDNREKLAILLKGHDDPELPFSEPIAKGAEQ